MSCDELIQSASETNFGSPSSGSCDLSVGSSGASSPLGGDIENMQMTDIMMEAISSSDILQDEDFICNLTDDTDVTMGMGKLYLNILICGRSSCQEIYRIVDDLHLKKCIFSPLKGIDCRINL